MDPKIIAYDPKVVGAFLALISNQIIEILRRREERKSLASAFAGEINAILEMGEHVQPAITISDYLQSLRSGTDLPLHGFFQETRQRAEGRRQKAIGTLAIGNRILFVSSLHSRCCCARRALSRILLSTKRSPRHQRGAKKVYFMITPSVGFEPTAKGLEIPCSIP